MDIQKIQAELKELKEDKALFDPVSDADVVAEFDNEIKALESQIAALKKADTPAPSKPKKEVAKPASKPAADSSKKVKVNLGDVVIFDGGKMGVANKPAKGNRAQNVTCIKDGVLSPKNISQKIIEGVSTSEEAMAFAKEVAKLRKDAEEQRSAKNKERLANYSKKSTASSKKVDKAANSTSGTKEIEFDKPIPKSLIEEVIEAERPDCEDDITLVKPTEKVKVTGLPTIADPANGDMIAVHTGDSTAFAVIDGDNVSTHFNPRGTKDAEASQGKNVLGAAVGTAGAAVKSATGTVKDVVDRVVDTAKNVADGFTEDVDKNSAIPTAEEAVGAVTAIPKAVVGTAKDAVVNAATAVGAAAGIKKANDEIAMFDGEPADEGGLKEAKKTKKPTTSRKKVKAQKPTTLPQCKVAWDSAEDVVQVFLDGMIEAYQDSRINGDLFPHKIVNVWYLKATNQIVFGIKEYFFGHTVSDVFYYTICTRSGRLTKLKKKPQRGTYKTVFSATSIKEMYRSPSCAKWARELYRCYKDGNCSMEDKETYKRKASKCNQIVNTASRRNMKAVHMAVRDKYSGMKSMLSYPEKYRSTVKAFAKNIHKKGTPIAKEYQAIFSDIQDEFKKIAKK